MRISVVIPLYNKASSIRGAIESVLCQTLSDFELIVIDDGSGDESAAIASSIIDARLRVVRQANGGASAARNRGAREVRGDWVAFLDADDRWEPRFLEACAAAALLEPRAVAVFSNILLEEARSSRPALPPSSRPILIEDYPAWFVAHHGRGISSSSVMVRRAALVECGGFPEGARTGEDTDTWFRLSWQGPVVYQGELLATYDLRSGQGLCTTSGPAYPLVCTTIDEKVSMGLLEDDKAYTALRARRFLLHAYALGLAQYGRSREAARLLRSVPPTPWTIREWLRALLAVMTGR